MADTNGQNPSTTQYSTSTIQQQQQQIVTRSEFANTTTDGKLLLLFDELRFMRQGQVDNSRVVLQVQKTLAQTTDKLSQVVKITNSQTDFMKQLAYKSIDLEARSRRNNLLFRGLVESYNEDCASKIKEFLKYELEIDTTDIYITRAHRLGARQHGQRYNTRPIIVNFRDFHFIDEIMSKVGMLRNSRFSIDRDYPQEINAARKRLWPKLKEIKSQDRRTKAKIVYPAKLIVNGRVMYDEFPDWSTLMNKSRIPDMEHVSRTIHLNKQTPTHDTNLTVSNQITDGNRLDAVRSESYMEAQNYGSNISYSHSNHGPENDHYLPSSQDEHTHPSQTSNDDSYISPAQIDTYQQPPESTMPVHVLDSTYLQSTNDAIQSTQTSQNMNETSHSVAENLSVQTDVRNDISRCIEGSTNTLNNKNFNGAKSFTDQTRVVSGSLVQFQNNISANSDMDRSDSTSQGPQIFASTSTYTTSENENSHYTEPVVTGLSQSIFLSPAPVNVPKNDLGLAQEVENDPPSKGVAHVSRAMTRTQRRATSSVPYKRGAVSKSKSRTRVTSSKNSTQTCGSVSPKSINRTARETCTEPTT